MAIITVNGKKYNEKKLNSKTKKQLQFLRITEDEIKSINKKIMINKTARNVYGIAIMKNLPEKTAAANRKNGIVTINEKKYLETDLNEKMKNDILVLKNIDKNLSELQINLAIASTAKNVYTQALVESLDKK